MVNFTKKLKLGIYIGMEGVYTFSSNYIPQVKPGMLWLYKIIDGNGWGGWDKFLKHTQFCSDKFRTLFNALFIYLCL